MTEEVPVVVADVPVVVPDVTPALEEAAVPVLDEVAAVVEPVVEEAISSVADVVGDVSAAIQDAMEDVTEAVLSVTEEASSTVADVVEDASSTVAEVVEDASSSVADVVEDVTVVTQEAVEDIAALVLSTSDEAAPAIQHDELPPPSLRDKQEQISVAPEPLGDFSGSVTPALFEALDTAVTSPSIVEEVKKLGVPKYADLGKEARDLLNKNFPLGCVNLNATTKSTQGFEFAMEGLHTPHTGSTAAYVETKYTHEACGLTCSWDTDNLLSSNISLTSGKLMKGLTFDLDTTYSPLSGKKTALLKTTYQHGDHVHTTCDVDFGDVTSAPTLHSSVVVALRQGLFAGYHVSYDTANKSVLNNNIQVSHKMNDVVLTCGVQNSSTYFGSVHHQVNDKLSAVAMVKYSSDKSESTFNVGGSYVVDDNTVVKAKLDDNMSLGLSYVQKLWGGLELTLAGIVNWKALEKGGHKLGVSLNFDA